MTYVMTKSHEFIKFHANLKAHSEVSALPALANVRRRIELGQHPDAALQTVLDELLYGLLVVNLTADSNLRFIVIYVDNPYFLCNRVILTPTDWALLLTLIIIAVLRVD